MDELEVNEVIDKKDELDDEVEVDLDIVTEVIDERVDLTGIIEVEDVVEIEVMVI
jgi:hypothetical protein